MRWFCFAVLIWFSLSGRSQNELQLKEGDLLFQANEPSQLTKAIEGAGFGYNGLVFSHVGIVTFDKGDTIIIEALPEKGVTCTPLRMFLLQSAKDENGKPLACVARLLPEYESMISQSVMRVKLLEGKAYDSVFLPDNDAYYCSELVFESYRDANGKSVFENQPMTFKDRATGEFYPAWIEFFARIKMPIPEGVSGTNPNDMSHSSKLKIIFCFSSLP